VDVLRLNRLPALPIPFASTPPQSSIQQQVVHFFFFKKKKCDAMQCNATGQIMQEHQTRHTVLAK
jgi:hypothetical protein